MSGKMIWCEVSRGGGGELAKPQQVAGETGRQLEISSGAEDGMGWEGALPFFLGMYKLEATVGSSSPKEHNILGRSKDWEMFY